MDLISIDPIFNLYNREWPILTWHEPLPPAKFVFADEERMGHALDSMVCAGVVVSGGEVARSVLSPSVHVHSYAEVEDSVLMPGVEVGRARGRAAGDHRQERASSRRARRSAWTWRPTRERLHRLRRRDRRGAARAPSWRRSVRVALLTREYPPEVYGGAGVHVEYLGRELARLVDLEVHCWGDDRDAPGVRRAPGVGRARRLRAAPRRAAGDVDRPDDGRGGRGRGRPPQPHLVRQPRRAPRRKLVHDVPHVATVHSLEPLRPWKAEQLGGGYALSSWCERTGLEGADAVIAVSQGMRDDILAAYPAIDPSRVSVVYNGIDAAEYAPDPGTEVLERLGVDPDRPSVVFVGRITRQKGVPYLLDAALRVRSRRAARALRGGAGHAGDRRRGRAAGRAAAGGARQRDLDRRDPAEARRHPALESRDGLRLSVDLRAAGDRQPRGDGLRGRGRRDGDGRDRRGRRRRRDGVARPVRAGAAAAIEPGDGAAFARRSPSASTRSWRTRRGRRRWARAGRARAVEAFDWGAIAEQVVDVYRSVAR